MHDSFEIFYGRFFNQTTYRLRLSDSSNNLTIRTQKGLKLTIWLYLLSAENDIPIL